MIIRGITGATAGLLLAQTAAAYPAIWRDDTLYIPHGVVVTEEGFFYYSNIFFNQTGEAEFQLDTLTPSGPIGGPSLFDEGAVYDAFGNRDLWIDDAAVITADGEGEYHSNVILNNADGTFTVTSSETLPLATIDSAALLDFDEGVGTDWILVQVEGSLSTPCMVLQEPAISVNEGTNVVTVLLAQEDRDPDGVCAQVITPFDVTTYLPVGDLDSGTYTVNINGQDEAEFTL